MRRHSIVARLRPTDTSRVGVREANSEVTEIHFIAQDGSLKYGLGQLVCQLKNRSLLPTDTALDLGLLATMVTAADTRISRECESQDSWTREIDLYIPVDNPSLWESVCDLIVRMLSFLTGDRWRIYFRGRHPDSKHIIRPKAFPSHPSFDSICLFSGGLDSFVGAIDLLASGKNPLFVSHYWDASTNAQEDCARELGQTYGDMVPRHVRSRVGFPANLVRYSKTENTTRGRSFLFFALATIAASGLDRAMTVFVPENGLISLNVPLDPLRIGAWSTRTTHPFYMSMWTDLSHRLGQTITWLNPFRFYTKGEMLTECANIDFLQRHLSETVSCSSIAKARWRKLPHQHCGHCVPCLIRRGAIIHAFGNDPTPYTLTDLADKPLNSKTAEGKDVRPFQMMAQRLTRHPEVARILVHKSGPLSDYSEREIADYTAVFQRGIAEVGAILKNVVVRPI